MACRGGMQRVCLVCGVDLWCCYDYNYCNCVSALTNIFCGTLYVLLGDWHHFCNNHSTTFFEDFALLAAACITIVANDDAYGVFRFESASLTSTIQETSGTAVDSNG